MRDRRMLSADGIFIVVATISEQDGALGRRSGDHLPRRAASSRTTTALLDDLRDAVDDVARGLAADDIREISLIQQHLHDDIAEFVYKRLKRRPMILPVVVEV